MLPCGSVASRITSQFDRLIATALIVLGLTAPSVSQQGEPAASLERFYIVKLATSDVAPFWSDYILDIRANGPDVLAREFQIAPLSRFCSDDVTVKAVAKVVPRTKPSQLSGRVNLCSPAVEQHLAKSLEKYSYRRAVTLAKSQRFGIVAKCGDDLRVIDLPYPQALNQKKLQRHARETEELFSLFDRLEREVFGPEPIFTDVAVSSDEHDMSLQQTAAKFIDDLKSGEFDRGFGGRNCRGLNSGCDEHPLDSLLKNYKGPAISPIGAQVRLLDADKLPLTRYVAPEYPAEALAKRVQDRVPLELELAPSGKVTDVIVLGGDAALRPSAVAAARLWEFKPGSGRFQQMTLDFLLRCP